MPALHVFDMDGTLLRESTANLQISRRLDCLETMRDLEDRFAAGLLDEPALADALCGLWGELTTEVVAEVVADAPWIAGIEEVCGDIAARGETSMLITMSPEFFARHLHRRGIEIVHGSRYPPLPISAPVDPAGLLTPADKVERAERERVRLGLPVESCVAYGDSFSDAALFAALPNTVAVNADPQIEGMARLAYRGDDLREAYAHARTLLPGAGSEVGVGAPGGS